jgi:predicted AlkP superfamily phosphohydrolase/phosphomutase
MEVPLPEISSVSWSSFMTGADPGEHGIFGFLDLVPGSKRIRFPDFRDVKVPTMWDNLAEQGKTCVVINQPATYPAREFPGALISGFVAVDFMKSVYPARYIGPLKRSGYELDIDGQRAREDHDYLMRALKTTLEGRRRAVDILWKRGQWDYFQVVVTGTDRLQHFLWKAVVEQDHPRHQQAMDYYRAVDRFVREIFERYCALMNEEEALASFYLLSDHGFTKAHTEFQLNTWLRQEGFQVISTEEEPVPENLHPSTKAFALSPLRIFLNRRDRFSDGCVTEDQVEPLCEEIADKLMSLRSGLEPVIERVVRGKDLYSGPQAVHAPDLIALTHPGYDGKSSFDAKEVLAEAVLTGMHTHNDAFFWAAYEEPQEKPWRITGLAPRLVASLLS